MGVVCQGESKIPEFVDLEKYQVDINAIQNIDADHKEKQPGAGIIAAQRTNQRNSDDGHGPLPQQGSYVEEPVLSAQLSRRLKELRNPLIAVSNNRGREVHKPFLFTKKNVIYEGQWRNHLPHGCGKAYYADGSLFEGEFTQGVPIGHGRYIKTNGDYFEGETKAGRANGKGLYVSGSTTYRGRFQDDKPHGEGVETNEVYSFEGTYQRGFKKEGTLTWREGRYIGTLTNDKLDGTGTLIVADGTYIGSFSEGLKHGEGVYQWNDGSVYRGEYRSGQKHGVGQYCTANQTYIYEGGWQEGRQHGPGTCWFGNPRQQLRGKWENGNLAQELS